MTTIHQNYGGLENLYFQASDGKDLEKRLQEFRGIGPTTAQIFLRELRRGWQVQPEIAGMARTSAANLNIALDQFEGERLAKVETALVKLYLRYRKRRKCRQCPMADSCTTIDLPNDQ